MQPSVQHIPENAAEHLVPRSLPSGQDLSPTSCSFSNSFHICPTHPSCERLRLPRFKSWPHLTRQLCDLEQVTQPLWAAVASIINGKRIKSSPFTWVNLRRLLRGLNEVLRGRRSALWVKQCCRDSCGLSLSPLLLPTACKLSVLVSCLPPDSNFFS